MDKSIVKLYGECSSGLNYFIGLEIGGVLGRLMWRKSDSFVMVELEKDYIQVFFYFVRFCMGLAWSSGHFTSG